MPKGYPNPTTQAFSPEAVRAAIRGRVAIPENMLQDALVKLKDHINAKEIKYFSNQGIVTDKREVDALAIQMRAIELIAQMSEIVSRSEPKPREARITLKIDPATGAMILIIGEDDEDQPQALPLSHPKDAPQVIDVEASGSATRDAEGGSDEVTDEEFEMNYIKVPRGTLSPELRQALFGPEVGSG